MTVVNSNGGKMHLGGSGGAEGAFLWWDTCSTQFEAMSSGLQFSLLAVGVFLFFGLHNLLQEAIMSVDGFRYGVMLGYTEVLGVAVCSGIERHYIAKERGRVAPLSAYPLLTACLMGSSAFSNMSLNYINFPTKVVFRSCKLIPTMVIASVLHKKIFSCLEYACAFAICAGLVMFAAADWESTPSFRPIGLVLVSASVCADAVLPNAQERLFRLGSSRLEVTLYTNVISLAAYTVTTFLSGDLLGSLSLVRSSPKLQLYFCVYTFIAYIAISMHMNVVKRFGGVAAVLLATVRKAMTLILSFLLFPKTFSWFYPFGAFLVLGGLLVQSLAKMKEKKGLQCPELTNQASNSNSSPRLSRAPIKQHDSDAEMAQLLTANEAPADHHHHHNQHLSVDSNSNNGTLPQHHSDFRMDR